MLSPEGALPPLRSFAADDYFATALAESPYRHIHPHLSGADGPRLRDNAPALIGKVGPGAQMTLRGRRRIE